MKVSIVGRRALLWPVLALAFVMAVPEVAAQGAMAGQSAAVYRHVEPGQPAMQVRVWGAVRAPGVYYVARGTDVVGLLSLAGGPMQFAETPNVERTMWLRIARDGDAGRQVVLDMPLSELTRNPRPIPSLQEGDVLSVEVEARQRFGWRDGLQIFSALGSVAVIVLNIMRLSN